MRYVRPRPSYLPFICAEPFFGVRVWLQGLPLRLSSPRRSRNGSDKHIDLATNLMGGKRSSVGDWETASVDESSELGGSMPSYNGGL